MDERKVTTVSLNDLLRPLWKGWVVILTAVLSVTLTALVLSLLSDRVYEASAVLSIREEYDMQKELFDMPRIFRENSYSKNQVTVLESRSLAARVVEKLENSECRDSLAILGNGRPNETPSLRDKVMRFVRSKKSIAGKPSFSSIVGAFQDATSAAQERESDIIILRGRASTNWEAAFLVNSWVATYQEYDLTDSREAITQKKKFLEEKLAEREKDLSLSEMNLTAYQQEENVVALDNETEQLVEQLANFQALYHQTQTDLEACETELAHLKAQLDESKKNLVDDMTKQTSPVIEALKTELAEKEAEKAKLEAQLMGAGYSVRNNPQVIRKETQIQGIRDKIIEETKQLLAKDGTQVEPLDYYEKLINEILEKETEKASLESKAVKLQEVIRTYDRKMESLPQKNQNLARFQRDVQLNSKIYMVLWEKYEETRIQEAGRLGVIRVVDLAEPPAGVIAPKTSRNLALGMFLGLLFGIGLAYSREFFRGSVRGEEDVEKMGFSVIGRIPVFKKEKFLHSFPSTKKDWSISRAKNIYPFLLSQQQSHSKFSEAYRVLRTAIFFAGQKGKLQTLLMTSPGPCEGKSTTASNLAITMARKGLSTLLVDSDLRRPVLDVLLLGSHRKIGLTHVLRREMNWQEAVRETSVKNLHVMPAGVEVKNAPELLGSGEMLSFIEQARQKYDIILFDSPPVLPVTDAVVLTPAMDGILLVMRSGKTTREAVRHAQVLLTPVSSRILGVVLTGIEGADYYGYRDEYKTYMDVTSEWKKEDQNSR